MAKILSRSGASLADIYDVAGSIAGIDCLETRELGIIHEMGATVASERFSSEIRRFDTGALNQNTTFDVVQTNLPAGIWRVLGIIVLANTNVRSLTAQVSLRDPTAGREVPVYVWDSTNDVQSVVRIVENGAAAANFESLVPAHVRLPSIGVGAGQPLQVSEIAFRGLTSGFGAGTVQHIALVHICFSQITGLSSRGLPIPSW